MKNLLLQITTIAVISVVALSVIVCAYSATGVMDITHMNHSIDFSTEHLDHAVSLALAIVPMIALIVFAIGVLVREEIISIVESRLVPVGVVDTEEFLTKQERLRRRLLNPRSPPFR